jgi:iron(III) transport system permease protein
MARSLTLPASPAPLRDAVRTVGVTVTLLVLSALTAWPLLGLVARGALAPIPWPAQLALQTLAVGLASTMLVTGPAVLIALAILRLEVPGRRVLWRALELITLIPPFSVPLAMLALAGPQGILSPGALRAGLAAIVAGQAVAMLPVAIALATRALAGIPVELEHAAELLGARRLTVLRRVTLGLAGPRLLRGALVVLGLCLADVVNPLLLGGDRHVLATAVIAAADPDSAARYALTLAALATGVALAGAVWREAGLVGLAWPERPRLDRPTWPVARWLAGAVAWATAALLVAPLAVVGAASIGHWLELTRATTAAALGASVMLGLGAALVGTVLALAVARIAERRRGPAGRIAELLARVPAIVPGVVIGSGYALLAGAGARPGLGVLGPAIAIVAAWELPVTVRAARASPARVDRSLEEVAGSLGASSATTLTRVVAPALRPVAGRLAAHLFAAAVLAVGTVIALTGVGPGPGAITMLTLATAGATGAACAVAVVLLALAGGALLLERAIDARRRGPTMLA